MPEARHTKNQFSLAGGLNTEAHQLRFPDGYSTDEQNYEIRPNGTRRRRRGLAQEAGGSALTPENPITTTQVHKSKKWRAAGGDPDKNFIVHQVGAYLYITDDAEIVSTTYTSFPVELGVYTLDEDTTEELIGSEACSFSTGRGRFFVANKYCQPFYIEYDPATATFTYPQIPLKIRDFYGINDGISNSVNPAGGVVTDITADHLYNLRNRGWKQGDIETYWTTQSNTFPAKKQFWYRGYRRITNVAYSDLDGIQTFDADKVAGEFFSGDTAGQGALLLNPMDTTFGENLTTGGVSQPIESWTKTDQGNGVWRITVTITGHGKTTNDYITVSGQNSKYVIKSGGGNQGFYSFDGTHQLTTVDSNSFYFDTQKPGSLKVGGDRIEKWKSWANIYVSKGQVDGGAALPNSAGAVETVGPTVIEYHGGHIFYAGMPTAEYADTIFFSQTALQPNVFGFCFQAGDPTAVEFNALLPNDGGTIVIPSLGVVKDMLSIRGNLIVFSDQGVWEIAGGQRGFFTADGYSVRKITDDECSSPLSPIAISKGAVYTGTKGIIQLAPNEFTGALEAKNVSETSVQTLWNAIPAAQQRVVQTAFDDALKRIYILYGDSGDDINIYANALVMDLRVSAYYKYKFNDGVFGAYPITDADSSDSNQKVKWPCHVGATIVTCDMSQSDYVDFDSVESPLPFLVTGWDNIGDFQRKKRAPVITVYQGKTETGFTDSGGHLTAVNPSSTLMRARWDFTDNDVAGKWGSQNQVYRHTRAFQPVDASDTYADGYPVVITRNKVRGRGRVLQLRFDGEATKDSHILGFSTNYKIKREV